jgi:FkbM family methyltransferase
MKPLGIWKPWYVHRPSQLFRRVAQAIAPPRDPVRRVRLPWGCEVEVDTRETIGKSVWQTGLHDMAVAEVLVRLTELDDLALDVGANVGVLTGALASRAAEVWAFEPHPAIHARLAQNVARFAGEPGFARCKTFPLALSDSDGTAVLESPAGFSGNQGLARLTTGRIGDVVSTARLDQFLAGRPVGVMKLDVEGHELAVLCGAGEITAAGLIRDIVYEDHNGPESEVARHLTTRGYAVFGIGWRVGGPIVGPPATVPHRSYEAPSYLATRRPAVALERCRPGGWQCLRKPQTVGRRS